LLIKAGKKYFIMILFRFYVEVYIATHNKVLTKTMRQGKKRGKRLQMFWIKTKQRGKRLQMFWIKTKQRDWTQKEVLKQLLKILVFLPSNIS
jgi:hypothetical protein